MVLLVGVFLPRRIVHGLASVIVVIGEAHGRVPFLHHWERLLALIYSTLRSHLCLDLDHNFFLVSSR